ncbi:MAG: ATP-binding protein, partial [Methylocystis sp.]
MRLFGGNALDQEFRATAKAYLASLISGDLTVFGGPRFEGDRARRVRAEQIDIVVRNTPWMMIATIANAIIVVLAVWRRVEPPIVLGWSSVTIGSAAYIFFKSRARRGRPSPVFISARGIQRVIGNAAAHGLLWGLMPVLLFPATPGSDQLVIACVCSGMLCGGAIAFATVPAAAIAFTAPIAFGAIATLFHYGDMLNSLAAVLVLIYEVILVRSVIEHANLFSKQIGTSFETAEMIDRLACAKEAADAGNRAKSSFLAMMSHEIRTPMNAVLGLSSALLSEDLNSAQREAVRAIYESGDNLLEILNDILDFSKFEAGQFSFETIPFSPESLIAETLRVMRPRAFTKNIELNAEKASSVPIACAGDPGRIRQVLLNLVSNAVKFTSGGQVVVAVRCPSKTESSAVIEWSVKDTGIGIPPDRIGSLFQDFVQVDDSISRRFGGSGLGLAICKRIVDHMKGEIIVTSTPNLGSEFLVRIELPLAELPAEMVQGDDSGSGALAATLAKRKTPLRLLIVDDNATNRTVACKLLAGLNIHIHLASNGIEAVEAVSNIGFDAVLMDMRMPEMDGMEATRRIRAFGGSFATLPIIAFTASAFAEDVKACWAAGMNDYLVKPIRKRYLISTLARWVATSNSDAVAAPPSLSDIAPCSSAEKGGFAEGEKFFDQDKFLELATEVGRQDAEEILNVLLNETTGSLKLLHSISCDANRNLIERTAHSLKGSAGACGLSAVAELARALESDAGLIEDDQYRWMVDQLDEAFA